MTGSVRSTGLALVAALVSAVVGGSCAASTVIVLTIDSSLVNASGRTVDQFEITLSAGKTVYDPFLVPELAGGALGDTETLNLVVPDSMADTEVTIAVNAYNDDVFVALGATTVTPLLSQQVNATVVLSACEADPALGGPFCDPVTEELVTCATSGETLRTFCVFGCNVGGLRCNDCEPDTIQCNGDSLVDCAPDGTLNSSDVCPATTPVCLVDRCAECNPSSVECRINTDGTGTIVTCDAKGTSIGEVPCPYACEPKADTCYDCFAGMTHCIGGDLVECSPTGTITSQTPCDYGCSTASTPDACNACTPSTTECQGDDLVTCNPDGTVSSTMPCTAFGCNPTVDPDVCNACDPDPGITTQCIGDLEVQCSTGGEIVTSVDCAMLMPPTTCNAMTGTCNDCTPGTTECTGLGDIADCNAAGEQVITMTCPFGCNTAGGAPACNVCTPDTVACQGTDLVDCDPTGSVIEGTTDCSAYGCQTGTTPDQCNECNPTTVECQAAGVVTCNSLGIITGTTPCPYGCDTAPVPPAPDVCYACTPGTSACQGENFVVCSPTGTIVTSTACGTLTDGCNTGTCTPTGCAAVPVANGTTCSDGLFCTVSDVCTGGVCGGAARDCSDGNNCTADSCDETVNVCLNNAAVLNGTTCDDGAYCTVGETCSSGVCGGAMARNCADTNPCTADSCNEVGDACVNDGPGANGTACSDGMFCTVSDVCTNGTCGGAPNLCNDTNPCTADSCDETLNVCVNSGTPLNGTACSDGLYCTVSDVCTGGSCGGGPRDCSDMNVCTVDSCNESTDSCVNNGTAANGNSCDDGLYCTVGDTCSSGSCTSGGARVCSDSNSCTSDSCSESTDACVFSNLPNGTSCEDGLYCTVSDSCQTGTCTAGTPRSCSDGNICTVDSCDETVNVCVNDATAANGTACDDGQYCTLSTVCGGGTCGGGTPRNCADTNACTVDSCDDVADVCVNNATAANGMVCDDSLFCTVSTICSAGTCGGGMARNCSDSNSCTADSCNEGTDLCVNTAVANGTGCSDGQYCTINDNCQSGMCVSGGARDCSDGFLCNTDTCNEAADTCDHPCIPAGSFCSTSSNLVTCAGSGAGCGETNTACGFGCNLTRNECNACLPTDPNVCTGSTAIVCDTVAPGEGTITSTSVCSYGCESASPSNFCFFPDTCTSAYVVPVSATANYGPTTFTDNMSNYAANVAGTCGAAGDDVIHSITIPTVSGFTAFSTIILDSTASTGIDTASHITTVCGSSANELQYASAPCGASIGAGNTCANTTTTDEVLRACGMPTGTYFATLDSTVSTGAYTLSMTVDNVNLDTCAESGNVSNTPSTPTTYTNTTTLKTDNYEYELTSSLLTGCTPSQRNACGLPNGDPTGNMGVCNSDGGATGEDIVFYYRAAVSGFLTVDTQGSGFDTVLYVKNGCNINCAPPSDCLACNDDHNFATGSWSRVYRYPVTAGTLYYIVVDGYGGNDGNVQLNVSFSTT